MKQAWNFTALWVTVPGQRMIAKATQSEMRSQLRRLLPNHESIQSNRWLKPFAGTLLHPRLWHLNRRSAAGAVAAGLFCGLIPGPFQMPSAAIASLVFRVNLPLALITTLYSNPFTIIPLYFAAYAIGVVVHGGDIADFTGPPDWSGSLSTWMSELLQWGIALGHPLVTGLLILATALSVIGYVSVRAAWRLWLIRSWHQRSKRKTQKI